MAGLASHPRRVAILLAASCYTVEGKRGAEPGRTGGEGVREAGEERAGSGIPKVAGTGRKGEKMCNIA